MSRIRYTFLFVVLLLLLAACGGFGGIDLGDQVVVRGSGNLGAEERDVPSFTAIRVDSSADVVLKTGPAQQVVASADDNVLPYLRTEVEGDTLVVDFRADEGRGLSIMDTQHPAQVEVTSPDVAGLIVNSSGSITAEQLEGDRVAVEVNSSGDVDVDNISADSVRIEVGSSGNVTIGNLEAVELEVTLSSSGDVEVAGEVQTQDVRLTSSGNYEAAELRSADAAADLSSSGNATLWATNSLRAETSSSGKVSYYGNPPDVRGEVTAMGGR